MEKYTIQKILDKMGKPVRENECVTDNSNNLSELQYGTIKILLYLASIVQ